MSRYRLTPKATADLRSIWAYIAADNVEAADRVDLRAVFDLDATVRHVDTVFDRLHALVEKEEPVHA